jgi:hypothetical protein
MKINTGPSDIKKIVLECLKEGRSAFMLRMGDGEMRIQNEHTSLDRFSIKEFGRKISKEEIQKAKFWMEQSVIESSILGLPTQGHYETDELWRCLFDYYKEIKELNPEKWINKKYSSINSHLQILHTGDLFEILEKVEKVVVVSSRDVESRLKERFTNIKEVESYSLPGEQAYEIEKNVNIDIFTRIEEICELIKSKNRTGELLIFGAGPIGKVIGCEFSKSGGVSLDIGSVFDLFVGKVTRGPGKGPTTKINPIL